MRSICLSLLLSLTLPVLTLCAVLNVPSEYATVVDALELVQQYDTVLLDSGTYSGPGFENIQYSGPSCWIIGQHGAERTVVELNGASFFDLNVWAGLIVWFEGLTLTGGNPAIVYSMPIVWVKHCTFYQNDVGVLDTLDMNTGFIEECEFIGNGVGMKFTGESWGYVKDCLFRGNDIGFHSHYGITTLHGNIFVGNEKAIYATGEFAVLTLRNNCIYANFAGIWSILLGGPDDFDVDFFECNDIYGNDYDFVYCPDPTGINGNISEDPLFCDTTFVTLGVASISPLLPEHNGCGVNIGNVSIGCYCGDINASGQRDISDLTFLVSYMFNGGPPPDPSWAGDVDGSGGTDISDVTYYVDYLFGSGPDPEC